MLDAAQRATGLTPGKARALLGQFLFSGEEAEKPIARPLRRRAPAAVARDPRPLGRQRAGARRADQPPRPRAPRGARGRAARRSTAPCCSCPTTARCSTPWARARSRSRTAACAATTAAGPSTRACARSGARPSAAAARARSRNERSAERSGAARSARREAASDRPTPSKNALQRIAAARARGRAGRDRPGPLEDELADPAQWASPTSSARATERHTAARHAVEAAYAGWEQATR